MRFKLLGKVWTLAFKARRTLKDDYGSCCNKRRRITIYTHPKDSEQDELDTVIHELLHAIAWEHEEGWVKQSAADMARILYRLGWRKNAPGS